MAKKHKHTADDPNHVAANPAEDTADEAEDESEPQATHTESTPPKTDPVVGVGLKPGGPTLAEYVASGYSAETYPPAGYAPRDPSTEPKAPIEALHGTTAMPQGVGDYHPNPDMAKPNALLQNSAPYLDEDTHDFGPGGGEEKCRICGRTRAELGEKIGKPLTQAELEHPDVKGTPLLPPRIR